MSTLLPIVKRNLIDSIDIERERKGTTAYMLDIYQQVIKSNPWLSGYITGFLVGSLDSDDPPVRTPEDIVQHFQQGTVLAKALSGAFLLYRLPESQAEADRMKEDLKLG